MPHLVLETSPGLLTLELADAVLRRGFAVLDVEPSIDSPSVKCRWIEAIHAFPPHAHLELRVLTGRDAETLARFSEGLIAVLREELAEVECLRTVEVREMERATYRK